MSSLDQPYRPLIPIHCTSDLVCARRVEVIEWRAGAMPKGDVVAALQIRQDYTPSELRRRAARARAWPLPTRLRA